MQATKNFEPVQQLIATDLDGTLLDDTYPTAEASRALDELASVFPQAQVILASSKTLVEMVKLAELCTRPPWLVAENGAVVAIPKEPSAANTARLEPHTTHSLLNGWQISTTGQNYDEICAILAKLRDSYQLPFRGFTDMSAAEVVSHTGLSVQGATDAKQRLGSEPILFEGSHQEMQLLSKSLARRGLTITNGGRFAHVSSSATKAVGVARLQQILGDHQSSPYLTVACGDAANDLDMLLQANLRLVFRQREGGYLLAEDHQTFQVPNPGPTAWYTKLCEVLEKHIH